MKTKPKINKNKLLKIAEKMCEDKKEHFLVYFKYVLSKVNKQGIVDFYLKDLPLELGYKLAQIKYTAAFFHHNGFIRKIYDPVKKKNTYKLDFYYQIKEMK